MKRGVLFAILSVVVIISAIAFFVLKGRENSPNPIDLGPDEMALFYKDGCPYCAAEESFFEGFKKDYPQVKITEFKISEGNNANLLQEFYKKYEVPQDFQGLVPATFVKDKYFVGFDEKTGQDIKNYFSQ